VIMLAFIRTGKVIEEKALACAGLAELRAAV
jgi:hypothetical protein